MIKKASKNNTTVLINNSHKLILKRSSVKLKPPFIDVLVKFNVSTRIDITMFTTNKA